MESSPPISIVVPAFNAQETIVSCVKSLLAQTYPADKINIIVVNNRSTDHTVERLGEFDGALTIVDEDKAGAPAAQNAGFRASETDWLTFIDADCTADAMWLRHLVRPLASPKVGLACGAIAPADPDHPIQRFGATIHNTGRAVAGLDIPYAPSANIAVRRDVFAKVGCFNEDCVLGQDVELSWRMQQSGYELIYVPDAVVFHEHESTLSGLFMEGYHHGLGSICTHKIHSQYLAKRGYRRNRCFSLRNMLRAWTAYVRGKKRFENACIGTFEAGKTAGKLVGSVKYRYFDL